MATRIYLGYPPRPVRSFIEEQTTAREPDAIAAFNEDYSLFKTTENIDYFYIDDAEGDGTVITDEGTAYEHIYTRENGVWTQIK